jgi:putative endonuclease
LSREGTVRDRSQAGKAAEAAVARWLAEQGYAIVATNLHVGRLELDIVARKDRTVVVVEVRLRGGGAWTSGFGSIDPAKRARIRRAGERLWQRRYRNDDSVDHLRFDAASVTFRDGEAEIEYAVAAF